MITDFPMLQRGITYVDNAATTFKPVSVIRAVQKYYEQTTANIHRSIHSLGEKVTEQFESVRDKVANFICAETDEVVFTSGATESINLVASSFPFKEGDVILVSEMEHHANLVPWKILEDKKKVVVKKIPLTKSGELDWSSYEHLVEKAVFVGVTHTSNVLGIKNSLREMIKLAHDAGAKVLVDAAQAMAHEPVDVKHLDTDFLVFSAHKMFGPTGVGVLYGKREALGMLSVYKGGGEMIEQVTFDNVTYKSPPYKFEAGTPHIAGVIGLGAAVDYLTKLGFERIQREEEELLVYATKKLGEVEGLTILGSGKRKAPIISFTLKGVHPHDIATLLDDDNIAVRAGHHCCQPLHDFFGVSATTRVSLCFYNTKRDIDKVVNSLKRIVRKFHG